MTHKSDEIECPQFIIAVLIVVAFFGIVKLINFINFIADCGLVHFNEIFSSVEIKNGFLEAFYVYMNFMDGNLG